MAGSRNNKNNSKKNSNNGKSTSGRGRGKSASGSAGTASGRKKQAAAEEEILKRKKLIRDEITAVIVIAVGVFMAIAFQTNAAGEFGRVLSDVFKGIFGFTAYILPYYFIIGGILIFCKKMIHVGVKSVVLTVVIYLMMAMVNAARFIDSKHLDFASHAASVYYRNGMSLDDGGVFGMFCGSFIVKFIGIAGLYILSVVVIFACLLLVLDTPVSRMFENAKVKKQQMEVRRAERIAEKERLNEEKRQQMEVEMMLAEDRAARKAEERERSFFGRSSCRKQSDDGLTDRQRKLMNLMESEDGVGSSNGVSVELFAGEDEGYHHKEINVQDPYELGEDSFWNSGDESDLVIDESKSRRNKRKKSPVIVGGAADVDTGSGSLSDSMPSETAAAAAAAGLTATAASAGNDAKEVTPMLSKKEARESMLKEEEMNQTKIINYEFPPVSLLKVNKNRGRNGDSEAELRQKAQKLEDVLHSFNIDADVTNVTQGPTVTRYEVHPNSGVKVKGIKSLADDIALNMEAKSIRIEAPIPGKPAVGIEIENNKINMVTVREIIDSDVFRNAKSKITFAVGKDISGNEIVADLKSMPHLLIAGSTGSGKSVCINSIITSLLYKARPDEVKLVLVDPKVVELANYNGIPHLLIPVVTDPAKAAAALNWAVAEMDERYRKFAEEGTRELSSFNEHMRFEGREEEVMPQVVIIIDELADLMMVAPSQVEDSICRLAQKARAAGMHLIVATQRPSVDVITGVIKANIPSRIAFAVSSQVDSRTILDMAGAEKLVGKGDMLFNPLGSGKPLRVQGTFISDQEVNDVISFVKAQTEEEPEYSEKVIDRIERANSGVSSVEDKAPDDELLSDAIELVVQAQQASVSMLQRRFRIGYNRAARIVDMMEERQIVGPQDGSRPRQVLITEEDLMEMKESTEDLEI